ncbi:unnamed protein product [Durusdinium trenchii]|uniref:Uncharacterized protein n=1 Tax=Durusdinium trenchii TaxID=1381693 RepID=A0ABP0JX56_9DINO
MAFQQPEHWLGDTIITKTFDTYKAAGDWLLSMAESLKHGGIEKSFRAAAKEVAAEALQGSPKLENAETDITKDFLQVTRMHTVTPEFSTSSIQLLLLGEQEHPQPAITESAPSEQFPHTRQVQSELQVSCLVLREEAWMWFRRKDISPMYLFRSYALNNLPASFHILVTDTLGNECEHVGTIEFDKCEDVRRFYPWKSYMLNALESKTWAKRVRDKEKVCAWRIQAVQPLDAPIRVQIGLRHVFSAESDQAKLKYILAAHPSVEHCFADCHNFEDMSGFCYKCGREHAIDSSMRADLHLCGPSCKDLSILEAARGIHNVYIMQDAMKIHQAWARVDQPIDLDLEPIYENVKSVAEQTRSATGDIHRPVIEVVKEDVEALGYRFAFNKVDSQHFLVRQRRNRVYGVAETHCGSTRAEGEFDRMLSGALSSLQTHFHFRMEECFLSDQPQEKIRGGRLQDQINVAMEKARAGHGENIFVDCSTSSQRAPEAATNVVTCVSPTHDVYSNLLQRFLKPEEFLWAQGIWRADAENPVAYDEMISSGLAQDLAGNSFTSTVVQAIVLSSFVSCDCWFHIELEKVKSKTTDTNKSKLMAFSEGDGAKLVERPSNLPQADEQQRGVKRKVRDVSEAKLGHRRGSPELTDQQLAECKTSDGDQLVQQPADEQKVVRRRLLQKSNPAALLQLMPKKKTRGKGPGNKNGKGKKRMATIWDKNEIFLAYDKAKASGEKNPIKAVENRKLPGYFPGCLYESKWGAARREQQWALLCASAPALCKKHKELPNSLRRILRFNKQKHGAPTKDTARCYIPLALEQAIESMILDRILLGEETTMVFVKNTIVWAVQLWNEVIEMIRTDIRNNGLETIKQQDEELAAMTPSRLNHFFQELADNSDELLQPINLDLNDAALLKKAQRLCHKFDIRYRSNEKPGLHLPFTHPSLERVRTYVSLAVKEKVIHPRLIANYDQVWSTNYRPAKRVLQKPGGARGLLRDPLSKSLAMRRIRHNIERCLNMDLTEEDPASTSVEEPSSNGLHQITGGSAGVAPVDEWRLPRTVTTISFVDGHVSRAYVTLRSGTMPESTRKRINQQLDKYLFIEQQQVTSHIWNEATQIKFLDFLAKEVRTRRKMLGLDATARALVLLDQAGAHMSRKYERIQEQWSRQHNIELMGGRSAVPVPGGFGASGGPNDGWHQWLHALTKSYLRLAVGWSSFPQLRTRLDELQMGLQSQPSTKQLGGVGLIAELLALSWLPSLRNRRLIWTSWLQRGYCSEDDIANWHFGGSSFIPF